MYYVDYGVYPVIPTGANCPTYPTVNDKYCLKSSNGNSFTYLPNTGTTGSSAFTLSATNNTTTYTTTNNSAIISPAPLSPVADWLALPQGDHYGNYYDLVTKSWATVTRTTPKTIYDPAAQKIYDVPAGYLAVNPRSDGKNGSEAVIEEGRTNQVINSNLETDSNSDGIPDGWADFRGIWTGAGLESVSSVESVYGQKSFRMEMTGTSGQLWSDPTTYMENGQTYVFSCYVKANKTNVGLEVYNGSSWTSTYLQSSQLNKWTRLYTTPFVFNSATGTYNGGSEIRITINGNVAAGPTVAYFDACQMEKGTFATSYIPTTTAASTRNADNVTVPTTSWSASTGTVLATAGAVPIDNSYSSIESWSNGLPVWNASNQTIDIAQSSVNMAFYAYNTTSHMSGPVIGSPRPWLTGYYVFGGTWVGGTGIKPFLNGVAGTLSAGYTTAPALAGTAIIGNSPSAFFYNGPIQRLVIYSSALSDSNVTTVTNAIKDGP
jgi:hypothetical protein